MPNSMTAGMRNITGMVPILHKWVDKLLPGSKYRTICSVCGCIKNVILVDKPCVIATRINHLKV